MRITSNQKGAPFPESANVGNNLTGSDPKLMDIKAMDFRPKKARL